jgi:hypothetical protein
MGERLQLTLSYSVMLSVPGLTVILMIETEVIVFEAIPLLLEERAKHNQVRILWARNLHRQC